MRSFKSPLLAMASATMVVLASSAQAGVTSYSGYFNDVATAALVASDLTLPLFGSDNDIANNVALYTFSITTGQSVEFQSKGFAAGGADPYFTLFSGTGNSATFFDSNYSQAFSTGGDFDIIDSLVAGSYTIAMGVFANMSCAENGCGLTLGEGFTGLGVPNSLGNYFYQLDVVSTDGGNNGGGNGGGTVPEPGTFMLVGAGILGLTRKRNQKK
jgi:hypothetical protein